MSVKVITKWWAKGVDGRVFEVSCDKHGVVAAYPTRGQAEDRVLRHAESTGEDVEDEEDWTQSAAG